MTRTPLVVACALGWLLTVAAFYPGVMSPDSAGQLGQARTGVYTMAHPPVMTLLWRLGDLLVKGPVSMLVLQATAWWVGLAMLVRLVLAGRPLRQAFSVTLIGLWPPLFAMVGTVWRDVHLTLACLLAVTLLLYGETLRRRGFAVVATVLLIYAVAVRVNGAFAVLPLAAWACWRLVAGYGDERAPGRRWLAGVAVLGIICVGRVANYLPAPAPFHQVQFILVFDSVGVTSRTGKNFVPAFVRDGYDSPAKVASLYTVFNCMPIYYGALRDGVFTERRIVESRDPASIQKLESSWFAMVRAEPRAYAAHRLAVFLANLGWNALPPHYPFERGVCANTLGVVWNPSPVSRLVYHGLEIALSRATLLFRPWVYAFLGLVVAFLGGLAWVRGGASCWQSLFVLGSAWMYVVPYVLIAPAADLRYNHWPMTASLLALLVRVHERHQARKSTPDAQRRRRRGALLTAGVFCLLVAGLARVAAGTKIYWGEIAPRPDAGVEANRRGLALMGKGEFAAAIPVLESAAAADPTWYVPQLNLAVTFRSIGRNDQAAPHFDRAVAFDRACVEAAAYRGEFRLQQRQYMPALADFTRVIDAGQTSYANFKGAAMAAAGTGNVRLGLQFSERCLQLDAARFGADIVAVAEPFFSEPNLARAGFDYFLELEARHPDLWWVHANLGALATRIGRADVARVALAEAERLKRVAK